MTAPIEHLFRGGEPVRPEDVPLKVLEPLRRLAVADPKLGASVRDAGRIYSIALRPGDASPMPCALAPDVEPE